MTVLLYNDAAFARRLADDLRYGTERSSRATLSIAATAGSGSLEFTARTPGAAGNNVSIVLGSAASLGIVVSSNEITINRHNTDDAQNTLDLIAEAVNGDAAASALVFCEATNRGTANRVIDGAGVPAQFLTGGVDNDGQQGAGMLTNFLLSQDVAAFLESLASEFSDIADSVAVNQVDTDESTTFTVDTGIDAAGAVALVGSVLTWDAGTANEGQSHVIIAADATNETIQMVPAVTATIATSDAFTVKVGNYMKNVSELRDNAGNPFKTRRLVVDSLGLALEQGAGTSVPVNTLLATTLDDPANNETVGETQKVFMNVSIDKVDMFAGYHASFADDTSGLFRVIGSQDNYIVVTPVPSGLVQNNAVSVVKSSVESLTTKDYGKTQSGAPSTDAYVIGDMIALLLDEGKTVTSTPFA